MVGVAQLACFAARPGWPAVLITVADVAVGARTIHAMAREGGFDLRIERRCAGAAALVRAHTEPGSVVLSMQHSGSVRYYAGRMSLRYDLLDPGWLDRSVEWLVARDVHVYALLDDWEVPDVRRRFAGQVRVARLEVPVATHRGVARVHVYDLVRPLADRQGTVTLVDMFEGPRCIPPIAPAPFGFKR